MDSMYTESYPRPNILPKEALGFMIFDGPGELTSNLLLEGWSHCIEIFAVCRTWVEVDVKKYLAQLCLNEATISNFVDTCRWHVSLHNTFENADNYTAGKRDDLLQDSLEHHTHYQLPLPPAMWQLGEIEDKTEGVMHLLMGIQKAVFKFIIRWAIRVCGK